ncbi:MAG: TonB-dependent receptor plug domain-containing protein [Puniceicoccaceae bacterium]
MEKPEHPLPRPSQLIGGACIILSTACLPLHGVETTESGSQPETSDTYQLDPYTVVGSRIRGIDLEATLPVVKLDQATLQGSGFSRIDDTLRSLPIMADVFNDGVAEGYDNFGQGVSTINMRGMGTAANLVLVNGLRMPPHDGGGGIQLAYNVDSIPQSAIESVEILADSASAIYGSDAVSGVVNFKTLQYYRGTKLGFGAGFHEGTNSEEFSGHLIHGQAMGDRGNLVLTLDVYRRSNLELSEYPYAASSDFTDRGGRDTSSIFSYPGWLFNPDPEIGFPPNSRLTYPAPTDNPGLEDLQRPEHGYNANGAMDYLGDKRHRGAYLHYDYDFQEGINGFLELYHQDTWTRNTIPATLYGPGLGAAPLPVESPYNPFGAGRSDDGEPVLTYVLGRLVGSGGRVFEVTNEIPRLVAGLRGTVFDDWAWESRGLWSKSKSRTERINFHHLDRFNEAMEGVDLDGNGTITREEFFNPFGPNTDALYEYMGLENTNRGSFELWMLEAHASGELMAGSDWSLKGAFGLEHRDENLSYAFGQYEKEGVIIGSEGKQDGATGSRDVTAAYGEMQMDYKEALTLQLAARSERYSDFGNVTTPKVSGSLRILPEVLLRASYGQGFVAPPLPVLYKPQFSRLSYGWYLYDPKRDETMNYDFFSVTRGNSKLEAEESDNYSLGLVLEPMAGQKGKQRFLSNLILGLNYIRIDYTNQIDFPDQQWLLDNEDRLDKIYPNQEVRIERKDPLPGDPNPIGQVTVINQIYTNLLFSEYEGYDIWVEWPLDLAEWGTLKLRWDGTWIESLNYAGDELVGTQFQPRKRWTAQFSWSRGDWASTWYLQCYGGVKPRSDKPEFPVAGDAYRVNAQVSYSGWSDMRWTLGVRNLFDRDPPFHSWSGIGAHYTHPTEKRFWYLRLEKTF